jgi:3-oxoadipate enol-lactonase
VEPALLLLHGFPLDSRMWRAQVAELGDLRQVLAPDLPGHGRSSDREPARSMDAIARHLAAFLDEVGVETVDLGGFSMGGYVAFAFCRLYPARVSSLILVATRAAPDTDAGRQGRDQMAAEIEKRGAAAATEAMLPKMLTDAAPAAMRDEVGDWMLAQPPGALVADVMAMRDRPDSSQTVAELEVPVLVLAGEQDPIIPLAEAETMAAAAPHGRLVVVGEAAHLVPVEQPRAINDALREHLGS